MSTLTTSLLLNLASELPALEKTNSWSPEEMMKTKIISDVQISPDNSTTLFVVRETEPKNTPNVSTKIFTASSTHPGIASSFCCMDYSTQPRWSPDGQWVAFLSKHEGYNNLFLISSKGGEAVALTSEKKDIQTFSWAPNGQTIAFVMVDETEEEKNREKTSLAYSYDKRTQVNRLWLVSAFSEGTSPQALTPDQYSVRGCGDYGTINCEFDWSPDSKKITFSYSPTISLDDFHLDSSIATLDLDAGCITPWQKHAIYEANPRYSPDGKWIAHLTNDSPQKYALNRHLALRSCNGELIKPLAPTFDESAFLFGPNLLGWDHNGEHLIYFEPKGTKFHLTLVPIDGSPATEIDTQNTFFKQPALSPDRTILAFVGQSPSDASEVHVANLSDFQPLSLTALNAYFNAFPKIRTEKISWKSSDNLTIEGLLTYPLSYQEGNQYPLILDVHGGPMGFFDETFLGTPNPYPLASFADAGFFILRPNPRGSCGYGKTFRCANYGDWGKGDYQDLMTGVDHLISQGFIDVERMGVLGWSYGGYMTAWIIGQTARFKAASIGAGLYNLVSMAGTTDLPRIITDYMGATSENAALYEKRSPISYVHNFSTACLIQHGMIDKRVPVSQAYELYRALERIGKTPELILYPENGHHILEPNMQLDAMKINLEWFQKHLN